MNDVKYFAAPLELRIGNDQVIAPCPACAAGATAVLVDGELRLTYTGVGGVRAMCDACGGQYSVEFVVRLAPLE